MTGPYDDAFNARTNTVKDSMLYRLSYNPGETGRDCGHRNRANQYCLSLTRLNSKLVPVRPGGILQVRYCFQ